VESEVDCVASLGRGPCASFVSDVLFDVGSPAAGATSLADGVSEDTAMVQGILPRPVFRVQGVNKVR